MTDLLYRRMEDNPLAENLQAVREYVFKLKERYQFFHWHVAFPDVFSVDSPHPKSFSQGEKDFLRRGTRDAELYENIASKAMVEISRDLRQRQTLAEEIVWEALRNRRLNNLKFRRQHPIAETQYVVDFLCYEARLIVEIDGGVHNQQRQVDAQRQREIEALGYRVIRFTNDEIYSDLHWVLANIAHAASQPSPNLSQGERNHPSPPGRRAGDEGYNEQTGWHGGFDCVLGNPPWERIKIQEKEWFAERAPEVASAPNAAARRRMIAQLAENDPYLLQAFADDKRKAEGESHFVRVSDRYPLCGRGDVNTYTIFAETSRHIINGFGRVGMIVPSGIATDDTTKFFFQDLMQRRSLVSLYDFENREGLFPGVDSRMKFSLVTMRSPHPKSFSQGEKDLKARSLPPSPLGRGAGGEGETEFAFFLHRVEDLDDPTRRFTLSAEDIAALNPNTGTMATFRSVRDAEITKAIYRRVSVLIREEPLENPWGISFLRMFDMSNDSDKFRTRDELESAGYVLRGNHFVRGDERYLPLYEAKMMHQFTHRWATYDSPPLHLGEGPGVRDFTLAELQNPHALPMPRYWVDAREVAARLERWDRGWLLGFRGITNTTNERTAIFSLLPFTGLSQNSKVRQLR